MSGEVMDSAYHVVHDYPGGAESLAPRLKKRGDQLSHEVAERGSAKFGLRDAVRITDLTGDMRILASWALHTRHMLVPLPHSEAGGSEVLQALGGASKEFADLCQAVCKGMADGRVSDNELDRVQREAGELQAMLLQLIDALRANNLAAKPVGLFEG